METEELHSILETATDGVVVVGADGEIRSTEPLGERAVQL